MLAQTVALEIRRLLDEAQLSHRAIARQLGVSRGVVDLIADGRRGLHGREICVAASDVPLAQPGSIAPVRCPGCGGKVYMPCLLCKARARQRHQAITASRWPRNHRRRGPRRAA